MHTHAYTHTQFFFLILSHTVPTEQEVPLSQHKLDGIPGKKKNLTNEQSSNHSPPLAKKIEEERTIVKDESNFQGAPRLDALIRGARNNG